MLRDISVQILYHPLGDSEGEGGEAVYQPLLCQVRRLVDPLRARPYY
jgi:hypothetical protein